MRAFLTIGFWLLVGCDADRAPCETDADCLASEVCSSSGRCFAANDPGACAFVDTSITVRVAPRRQVDLLFMIDGTVNVSRVADLAGELPGMFRELSTGVVRGEEHPPVESLRVGLITQDMGTGPTGACGDISGDDGILQTNGNTANPSCMAIYPPWLEFAGDADALATDVGCVMRAIGTDGCGFEQPLESILKAITPSTSEIPFAGSPGHGDGVNAGFLRQDSLLVVVALTDEDDCSAADLGVFDPDDPRFDGNLNLRCIEHPEALHPVERYVRGLVDARNGRPGRLLYALIAGVPPDLALDPNLPVEAQLDALLADERMQSRASELDSTQLVPSCNRAGFSRAFPPRRLTETALGLSRASAHVWVDTICDDMVGPVDRLVREIFVAIGPPCLSRALPRGPDGRVACELVERTDGECEPGRIDDGESGGLRRCLVPQLAFSDGRVESGEGWYYDDFSPEAERCFEAPRRVAFTRGAEPVTGATFGLECQETEPGPEVGVGTYCGDDSTICDDAPPPLLEAFPGGLVCHPTTRTCQPPCARDAECAGDTICGAFGYCYCAF